MDTAGYGEYGFCAARLAWTLLAFVGPDLSGRSPASVGPDLSGRSSASVGPDLSGRSPASVGPDLSGRSSASVGPDLSGRSSAAVGPDLSGRSSASVGPDLSGRSPEKASGRIPTHNVNCEAISCRQHSTQSLRDKPAPTETRRNVAEKRRCNGTFATVRNLLASLTLRDGARTKVLSGRQKVPRGIREVFWRVLNELATT